MCSVNLSQSLPSAATTKCTLCSSRNWGGWLANEAFEYLIGTPEVLADQGLRQLLWRYRKDGGFEDALAELQASLRSPWPPQPGIEYNMGGNLPIRVQATALQAAIGRMFKAMNTAYDSQFEFDDRVMSFLARFDAIFTLNQDTLLERLYVRRLGDTTVGGKKWLSATLPGMRKVEKFRHSQGVEFFSEYWWEPAPKEEFPSPTEPGLQPIYKLHGSSQWRASGGGAPILIIGGEKSLTIKQFPILDWYAKCFDAWLTQGTRLMVIGYGFGDKHINDALLRAGSEGLQLFIVDPDGLTAAVRRSELTDLVQRTVIGASRRPIRETIQSDVVERTKVMQFFD